MGAWLGCPIGSGILLTQCGHHLAPHLRQRRDEPNVDWSSILPLGLGCQDGQNQLKPGLKRGSQCMFPAIFSIFGGSKPSATHAAKHAILQEVEGTVAVEFGGLGWRKTVCLLGVHNDLLGFCEQPLTCPKSDPAQGVDCAEVKIETQKCAL